MTFQKPSSTLPLQHSRSSALTLRVLPRVVQLALLAMAGGSVPVA